MFDMLTFHVLYVMEYVLSLTRLMPYRKTKFEAVEASTEVTEPLNIIDDPKVTSSLGVIKRGVASLSSTSPVGVTIRRMVSLSPTSLDVTTRSMASISPGGINRKLIFK